MVYYKKINDEKILEVTSPVIFTVREFVIPKKSERGEVMRKRKKFFGAVILSAIFGAAAVSVFTAYRKSGKFGG